MGTGGQWGRAGVCLPTEGDGIKAHEDRFVKGRTPLPLIFILQLVSQKPFSDDTPGSSCQLLKSDKIPLQLILLAESSRLMHSRLSLLT